MRIDLKTVKVVRNEGNPTSVITRPDNTTAYDAGDVVGGTSSILTFSSVLPTKGVGFIILSAYLKIPINAVPTGMDKFMLHLYNASPTNIADGSAFNLPAGDLAKYLGYVEFAKPIDLGDNLFSQVDNINFSRKLATDSNTLYGMLQTVGPYSPTAEVVMTVGLEAVGR